MRSNWQDSMKSRVAPMTIEILYYNLAQQDMSIPEPFGSDARTRWQIRSLRAVEISSVLKSMSIDCSTSDRHLDIVIRQRDRRYALSLCCGKYLILTPKWFFAYQSLHRWLALSTFADLLPRATRALRCAFDRHACVKNAECCLVEHNTMIQ